MARGVRRKGSYRGSTLSHTVGSSFSPESGGGVLSPPTPPRGCQKKRPLATPKQARKCPLRQSSYKDTGSGVSDADPPPWCVLWAGFHAGRGPSSASGKQSGVAGKYGCWHLPDDVGVGVHLSPEMIPPASCEECVLPMGPEGPG